jgi:hypothetical protein
MATILLLPSMPQVVPLIRFRSAGAAHTGKAYTWGMTEAQGANTPISLIVFSDFV